MPQRILITGSSGLVGGALTPILQSLGIETAGFDILGEETAFGDVRNPDSIRHSLEGCDGVIHLAAISRVVWAEQDPEACKQTNINGLQNVLDAATGSDRCRWLMFASSREVYGQQGQLPVNEDAPLRPMNVYGHAKVEGEKMVTSASSSNLLTCIFRLSNVYGTTSDHADRVTPAFARCAVEGTQLRIDGAKNTFDFTHIDDVTSGLAKLVQYVSNTDTPPSPIHFVTGQPTSLGQLAERAIKLADSRSKVRHAPGRNFDVSTFWGNPDRARSILGWQSQIAIDDGLQQLVNAFRSQLAQCTHLRQGLLK